MSIYVDLMLKIFYTHSLKSLKMTLDDKSIPAFARKRERIAPTFSTPPGSPFRALTPIRYPMAEPRRRGRENDGLLSAGPLKKLIHLKFIFNFKYSIYRKRPPWPAAVFGP